MSSFDAFLKGRLAEIEAQNLRRTLRTIASPQGPRVIMDGREVLHFSSNDYLGLAANARLKQAAHEATEKFGAGSGASRLISGSLEPHHQLERALAQFKEAEAALVLSTGYATALGTITALLSRDDFIVLDKLVHASIVDAARLSGAQMRIFRHNDPNDLADVLKWCSAKRKPGASVLVVTESLFSMDGDIAPLAAIADLKDQHDAWLMVDEAHATGLFGSHRRGLIEEAAISGRVEIQMGTLGKALGSSGGYIVGSRALVDFLVNRARSFIFSTAPPPSASAAACAALEIVQSPTGAALRARLCQNIQAFGQSADRANHGSPIVPVILGAETEALRVSRRLLEEGVYVPAIRFPTVARNQARLRISFTSLHQPGDIQRLRVLLGQAA